MFKKLFSQFNPVDKTVFPRPPNMSPAEAEHVAKVAEMAKSHPLFGAKSGSKEVTERMKYLMETERGVRIDSVLYAIGAMAGYACQVAVRYEALVQGLPEYALLTADKCDKGTTYYFGEALNAPLLKETYSVWGIAAGGAQEAGCTDLPDLETMFSHTSQSVGTPAFGVPQVPDEVRGAELPIDFLRKIWPHMVPVFNSYCPDPRMWPALLACSAQEVIVWAKEAMDPALALTIVMESAIPMSKVDILED